MLKPIWEGLAGVAEWRVFWVAKGSSGQRVRSSLIDGWENVAGRQAEVGTLPGDPIFLAPNYGVDELLSLYVQSRKFRRHTPETKRNYATDISLWLNFLWGHNTLWTQAVSRDLEDYEHWRRFASSNPRRVGGSKWNRELAALTGLYTWSVQERHMPKSPVEMRQVLGRNGGLLTVAAAKAKDSRPSNVHWLTPRAFRRWVNLGLRGHTRRGVAASSWIGRLEDRNVAYANLLMSSGLRRGEGGSLLTFEIPRSQLDGGQYYSGKVAAAVTRAKKQRTFYVASSVVGEIETYIDSSRAMAVRKAQKANRYEMLPEARIVTDITGGIKSIVRWRDQNGVIGQNVLTALNIEDRMNLYMEGRHGLEPLWLWLNERGMPLRPHSWEGVFREANERCKALLTVPEQRYDPHQVYAPYVTPHSCRHSFALYMLVVLNHLMDKKYDLTPEERRDFRILYGDPWRMVQDLLGHAQRETTCAIYLAPVADLQLRSLLAVAPDVDQPALPNLDGVFAQLARESEGIQDINDQLLPPTRDIT